MSPRLLGAAAIIVRSFARIHESNLKKQGLLALAFEDPACYDRVQETDRISLVGLNGLAPGEPVDLPPAPCRWNRRDHTAAAHLQRPPDRVVQGWGGPEPAALA